MDMRGMNRVQMGEAIPQLGTVAELEEAWTGLESTGFSKNGLLYAEFLVRKQELGAELTEEEVTLVETAARNFKAGKELPPITGKFVLGQK